MNRLPRSLSLSTVNSTGTPSTSNRTRPARVNDFSLPSVVVGKILDEDGKPLNGVRVRAEQSGVTRAQANSDFTGEFVLNIFYGANPTNYTYDISATLGEKGEWRLDTVLPIGERKSMDFTLKDAISTQGAVMTLDRNTPQASVVVQAIKTSEKAPAPTSANAGENEKVAATVLTDEKGKYKFINLRPGQYRVRCQTPGEMVYYDQGKTIMVELGQTAANIDFYLPPLKKGTWKNFTFRDGLANNDTCKSDAMLFYQ